MGMTFGGSQYLKQCPWCDAALDWRAVRGGREDRIRQAFGQHDPRCRVKAVDPARLKRCRTPEEALALAVKLEVPPASQDPERDS